VLKENTPGSGLVARVHLLIAAEASERRHTLGSRRPPDRDRRIFLRDLPGAGGLGFFDEEWDDR
jgi:hypothetical protein